MTCSFTYSLSMTKTLTNSTKSPYNKANGKLEQNLGAEMRQVFTVDKNSREFKNTYKIYILKTLHQFRDHKKLNISMTLAIACIIIAIFASYPA